MGVNMTTADAALKTIYGDLLRDQLNLGAAAVSQKFATSNKNIEGGSKVVRLAPFGVNGGSGAGTETGALPTSGGNKYARFESTLKNLYGTIEISDKAILASKTDKAAFVNLFEAEMAGIMKAVKHSYGRQIYMDGTGNLTACGTTTGANVVVVASTQYLIEGQIIDIVTTTTGVPITNGTQRRIAAVDHTNKTITLDGAAVVTTSSSHNIQEQGSYNNELTGLKAILATTGSLYGLSRTDYQWLKPQVNSSVGAIDDEKILKAIFKANNMSGGKIDFIAADTGSYIEYYTYLKTSKSAVNTLDLKGGFSALSINNIALAEDRFMTEGTMYCLDSAQFTNHELQDWDWLQDDLTGAVLKQVAGYAKYSATLRKYAELICNHPGANVVLSGITVS
jgi:hypothetical protein